MHSYGGQVSTEALSGLGAETRANQDLQDGVVQLVYMCFFAPPEGWSMFNKVDEIGQADLMSIAFHFEEDKTVLNSDPKTFLVSPEVDDVEANAYVSEQKCWSGHCMY